MVRTRSFLLASISLLLTACQAVEQIDYRQDYFELRDGLERSRAVFERAGKGRVAFLGGSITYNPGWRDQLCDWLRARFPATEFEFVAAGIPSTGSTPGAFRIARDVFGAGKIDLLFEEAAVNDSTNGRTDGEQVRAMEGIVRQARSHNPAIDVVLVHFVDPGKIASYDRGRVPMVIQNHERVANHYGLPSLNLALEVSERIGRGEFTWRDDFKNLHPSPFGQALYARAMQRMLAAAWPAGRSPSPRESALLPPPLDPFCYDRGRLLPPDAVAEADGFELIDRWQNEVGGGTRPGFVDVPMLVGTRPGASLRCRFHGSAVGVFVAAGPDAGVIEYRIDGGAWQRQDLFTRWSRGLHLPWLYVLAAELERGRRVEHELELRIAEQQNDKSRGHACRIVHFAVNGA